ncbi:dihydrolipoamide S-succinyltransferase, e2 component of oxoglutarate dehydrogenase complex Kgd2 [Schizosaccharomyces pombe]|uniref:Probable dihydrolipoyllysine-residue succinyltransferase component of 2-oxoglutarate dehydrogenase complex, mitochondrial n=1 Tax=Schizosaccharomyces pombe (strain 972 / ATCC 24843) TaxID=284812 RepID=ODO2_SCHPO|nr:dihydrolipoyllysine-residue succinyltransferase [Schizosaccharomyces pombe]O94681.1 RecName: Full=Probable dihydrolipoyllysine-residue succinyltransferase component of 2-oxoglutarate dehydrogenase complex, mitochondrial; AltName: Full=2-oxoglutarate dehydrogenase complex component E2; Short=OGDC-E2; AltName: Full=Probable dihydrolipoamide succinyltransferase component of 2-oxoglutarate dehydrogenase complex; Flags: Precursor [Schizosaccharomyces pombe 972h-]CAA22888.1 dihydrolipoamide S-succin|eukprot:NP_596331.1 dihydrolipoyllysine-residue succinyltransferase [Schizosaccharomyces pombe]
MTSYGNGFRMMAKCLLSLRSGYSVTAPVSKSMANVLWARYASTRIKTPPFPESITEGTLAQWLKQPGEYVNKDEEIASVETDKIDAPVTAPDAGVLKEQLVKEGDTITIDQDIAVIDTSAAPPEGGSAGPKKDEVKTADADAAKDLSTPQDSSKPIEEKPMPDLGAEQKESAPSSTKPAPDAKEPEFSSPKPKPAKSEPVKQSKPKATETARPSSFSRNEDRVKMNRMRLRIAERLKESQNRAASLTTFNECDMSAVVALRKKYKDEILKETGVKIGFMSFFSKACTQAMKQIPAINGSIEGEGKGDTLVYRDFCDLSIAVATPKGLVTPVIRNAESMSLLEIESAIATLGSKARAGKLAIEDMASGTFTISNGGIFGSLYGTPIINLPQTAVLGLHAIKERPVVINGQVVPRPMMYLALTYDHRMVDGREAVTFLRLVKEYIEDPAKMLLV